MDQLTVERSIWVEAARERVWGAMTEPEQLARWLLPPLLGAQMRRDDAGTIIVCMGPMEIPIATVEVADPPQQWTVRSLPARQLATTYRLDEEQGGTRITVTTSGFEQLPEDARQDRLEPIGMGWEKALTNLQAYLGGAELPFPEGYVAALFGYRRLDQVRVAVERSIWIKASRERVWHALTDPAQIQLWFSPTTAWELSAPDVGGRLYVRDEETGGELYTQVIEKFDRPRELILRALATAPDVSFVTIYRLEEERAGTRLTLTYTGYELQPEETRWSSMEQTAFGYGMMLDNLRASVEGTPLPYPGGF